MSILAPVGISVYTRIKHFKRSVQALKQNELAKNTNLVIYSDAPSRLEDELLVKEVREYAFSIQGFRTVTVIERPTNYGGVRNAHEGLKQLVRIFKVAIFLEDDIEVASGFLMFMNRALDFYKDNPNVTSISGYSPPLAISDYVKKDFYTMNRFCGWGCGVYERTVEWLGTKITQKEFDSVIDKQVLCEFGDDVLNMTKREVAGELDAADVRCMFRQAVQGKATIYPRFSLVQNNGHDGSGVHCGKSKRFEIEQLWDKTDNFNFDNDIACNLEVKKEKQDFRAFRGRYKYLRTICNINQSKEVTSIFLDEHFEREFSKLLQQKSPHKINRQDSLVLLSSPRVGSTWLCENLTSLFGDCIVNEWLHRRFVEKYLKAFRESTPLDYLNLLQHHAFPDASTLALHIHINQHRYWMSEFGINLFEYFSFRNVFYMQRKNVFDQIFSYAVASETGLWGDGIVQKMNISDKFLVSIGKIKFEKAEKALLNEFRYFEDNLKSFVTTQFDYESMLRDPANSIIELFSDFVDKVDIKTHKFVAGSKITKAFIDSSAKSKLKSWFRERLEERRELQKYM